MKQRIYFITVRDSDTIKKVLKVWLSGSVRFWKIGTSIRRTITVPILLKKCSACKLLLPALIGIRVSNVFCYKEKNTVWAFTIIDVFCLLFQPITQTIHALRTLCPCYSRCVAYSTMPPPLQEMLWNWCPISTLTSFGLIWADSCVRREITKRQRKFISKSKKLIFQFSVISLFLYFWVNIN